MMNRAEGTSRQRALNRGNASPPGRASRTPSDPSGDGNTAISGSSRMGGNIAISNGSRVDGERLELNGGGEERATAGSGEPIGGRWKPVWLIGSWVDNEQLAVIGNPETLELSDDDEEQGEDDHSTTSGFENPNTGYETGVDRPFGGESEHIARMFGQGVGGLYIPGLRQQVA